MAEIDHELEVSLGLDGYEFDFTRGYRVPLRGAVDRANQGPAIWRQIQPDALRPGRAPHYGIDNAHAARRQALFDHRHGYGSRRMGPYAYRGLIELVDDFYREVARILRERGVL